MITDRKVLTVTLVALAGLVGALAYGREGATPVATAPEALAHPALAAPASPGVIRAIAEPNADPAPEAATAPARAKKTGPRLVAPVAPFGPESVQDTGLAPGAYPVRGPGGQSLDISAILARIAQGRAHPDPGDGIEFDNAADRLLAQPTGYYRQFVCATLGQTPPPSQRIIVGKQDEAYYTADGVTFTRLMRWRSR